MPILERDPWRLQYFEGVACPEEVVIPTDEAEAYRLFPQYRHVHNKLWVAESQGLVCGLHGIDPPAYPVFSKPVYNMRGMGTGGRVLRTPAGYQRFLRPGHFWMELLEGDHTSSDVAVVRGEARWWRHTTGLALADGMFDYWTVLAEARPEIESYGSAWIREHLSDYTGIVNFETIGTRIIEVHLRFADQWPDLYGEGWLEALVRLYTEGTWDFADRDRRDGYSVVLFGAHDVAYRHPDPAVVERILERPDVTSVQITFHEDKPPWAHAMPPGGFRLAIVNGWDLDVGREARQELALAFWSTQTLIERPRRRRP
ncbi:MAG: hypothetical protein R3190_13815, partial [Thermoanaerobaculia bacterium]|nr:hypothetical protein [Thermoanaerobaculia bacterium]